MMNLDLQLFNPRGRKAKSIDYDIGDPLTSDDLIFLNSERGTQKPESVVKRLSDRHRNLAKLIADGVPDWEACLIVGYSASRISILKSDPAFKELVKLYQQDKDIIYRAVHEQLASIGKLALDIIEERLEGETDEIPSTQIMQMGQFVLDRSGFGPQSSTNVNVNVTIAQRLDEANKRIAARKKAETIEGQAIDITEVIPVNVSNEASPVIVNAANEAIPVEVSSNGK